VIVAELSPTTTVGVPGASGATTEKTKLTSLVAVKYLGLELTAAAVALTTQVPAAV
jgi:hypothetical protein